MRTTLVCLALLAVACHRSSTTATQPTATGPATPAKKVMTVTTTSPEAAAAFATGRDLAESGHRTEAIEQLERALELDPTFALAHAYLGNQTMGPDGMAELRQAAALAKALPEAERLYVESFGEMAKGDYDDAVAALRRVAELVPDDFRVQRDLGLVAYTRNDLAAAAVSARRATTLEPKAAGAWNLLGVVYGAQGAIDAALASVDKALELQPGEASYHDTRGEVLLAAGRFDDAIASFDKATRLAPTMVGPWLGAMVARQDQGDHAGALEVAARARKAVAIPADRLRVERWAAWVMLDAGKRVEALATLQALVTAAEQHDTGFLLPLFDQAWIAYLDGRYADAVRLGKRAAELTARADLPPYLAANNRQRALVVVTAAQAWQGKAAESAKSAAEVKALASTAMQNAWTQAGVAYTETLVLLARNDLAGAAVAARRCHPEDAWCLYDRLRVAKKVGDKAELAAARKALLARWLRDPRYAVVRSRAVKL